MAVCGHYFVRKVICYNDKKKIPERCVIVERCSDPRVTAEMWIQKAPIQGLKGESTHEVGRRAQKKHPATTPGSSVL